MKHPTHAKKQHHVPTGALEYTTWNELLDGSYSQLFTVDGEPIDYAVLPFARKDVVTWAAEGQPFPEAVAILVRDSDGDVVYRRPFCRDEELLSSAVERRLRLAWG